MAHAAGVLDRVAVRGMLGIDDPATVRPPRARSMGSLLVQGVRVERIVLTANDGHEVPCLYLVPAAPPPWPVAVVAVHQHNGEFQWGKSEVAGLMGDPDQAYGLELALSGIPVIAPDLLGFEDRQRSAPDAQYAEHIAAWRMVAKAATLQGSHTNDVALATSWLIDQPGVGGRVGVVGHSLGGQVAFFSLVCDPRLSAAVVSCGVGTLGSFESQGVSHNPAWYVPGLEAVGDVPAVAATISEQRLLVSAGSNDLLFPEYGVREVVDSLAPGVGELRTFEGGHAFPGSVRSAALGWLADALKR
jgi:dienelactone hydrolase